MNKIEIHLLGSPAFLIDSQQVKFSRKKAIALMIYLVCTNRKVIREELAEMFWPSCAQSKALSSLRTIISEIKSLFPKGFLITSGDFLFLEKDSFNCDLITFRYLISKNTTLKEKEKAVQLWNGGFIKGFYLNTNCEFTSWQLQEEQNVYFNYKILLKSLYEQEIKENNLMSALTHARSCLNLDNFDEESHRAIIYIHALRGEKKLALNQYELCKKIMSEEFKSPLEDKTQELFRKIKSGEIINNLKSNIIYKYEPRIAILPFHTTENISKDSSLFLDIIMEGLEDFFAKVSGIKTISRTSSMTYINSNKRISTIAQELLADYIIEGFIGCKDGSLLIEGRLIDTKLDTVLKIKKIHISSIRDIKYSNITRQIGSSLIAYLANDSRFNIENIYNNQMNIKTNNPLVNNLKLQAKHLLRLNKEADCIQAIELYQKALNIEPNNAEILAGLSKALFSFSNREICCPNKNDKLLESQIEAQKSLEINPNEPTALNILGKISFEKDWNFVKAENFFKRTLKISPNNPQAIIDYAELCIFLGRLNEARNLINKAIGLDPINHQTFKVNFWLHLINRDFEQAEKIAKHQFILYPAPDLELIMFSYIYLLQGKINNALKSLELITKEIPISWSNSLLGAKGYALAKKGEITKTYQIIEILQKNWQTPVLPHLPIALIYIGLNEFDNALDWVEAAVKLHDSSIFFLIANPLFSPLYNINRFKNILKPTHIKIYKS